MTKSIESYQHFIKEIVKTRKLYYQGNRRGPEMSASMHYANAEGEPAPLYCYWSSRAGAVNFRKGEWATVNVTSVRLDEFLENWCAGMHLDGAIVGVEFDDYLSGREVEPRALAADIIQEVRNAGLTQKFEDFSDLDSREKELNALPAIKAVKTQEDTDQNASGRQKSTTLPRKRTEEFLARYRNFIETTVKNGALYVLKDEWGEPMTWHSYLSKGAMGFSSRNLCVWSSAELAEEHIHEPDDEDYSEAIPLAEFIEEWCFDLTKRKRGVGIELDDELNGTEKSRLSWSPS